MTSHHILPPNQEPFLTPEGSSQLSRSTREDPGRTLSWDSTASHGAHGPRHRLAKEACVTLQKWILSSCVPGSKVHKTEKMTVFRRTPL